jgi:adenylate cyclase class 2
MIRNVEIKARCGNPALIRSSLLQQGADFIGTDHQRDTYFNVPAGRLKLRQGNIENALIRYLRPDQAGPKTSEVTLCPISEGAPLEHILNEVLGTKVVVDKQREIFFIGNIKFHIDRVEGLGGFVEIEAIDKDGSYSLEELTAQCQRYLDSFGIHSDDLLSDSYSDMILRGSSPQPSQSHS